MIERLRLAMWLVAAGAAGTVSAQKAPLPPAPNTCVDCHLALDHETMSPPARLFAEDIHAHSGFTCVFCHGGDASKDDQELAHDARRGFRGKPSPREIPELCGRCHADADLMKRFSPSQRVDQLAEYRTSRHGQKLAQGDVRVAQCVSCHGAHGILPIKDSRSPVSANRVASTCNGCHGDAALMALYKLPADAHEKYGRSVHALARAGGDLSAPTCNSCHGNHGAAPPEVGSVANVCGTCHAVFAEKFKLSPHWEAFAELGQPGCVTCHGNHEILEASDELLATGERGVCESCHEAGSPGADAAKAMHESLGGLHREIAAARGLIQQAREAGMEVSRQEFDLVQAEDALTRARADVHLARLSAVTEPVARGVTVARESRKGALAALRELDVRRKGLFISLVFVGLAILGLVLKIRSIERGAKGPSS
ncbi:MAG TPA: cytochrome c3 family protein [Candidatus Eisenbacteria bacterium]